MATRTITAEATITVPVSVTFNTDSAHSLKEIEEWALKHIKENVEDLLEIPFSEVKIISDIKITTSFRG